jgi:hypothetical protein
MAECPWYYLHYQQIVSDEFNPDPGMPRVQIEHVPICNHPKHSPFPRKNSRVVGAATVLPCRGTLALCPLTAAQFQDV